MKLPARPGPLTIRPGDIVTIPTEAVLWRIHPSRSPHSQPWDRLRFYGPTTSRFDPHPPPPRIHTSYAVSYAAPDPYTPFAEVYQRARTINVAVGDPYLTAWRTTRPIRLLDLTGDWPVANGASRTLNTGRHDSCRAWAHAIHDHAARVDGLWHTSAITGSPAVTLFTPAADSFPPTPAFSRALADPALLPLILAAARRFNYRVAG